VLTLEDQLHFAVIASDDSLVFQLWLHSDLYVPVWILNNNSFINEGHQL